MSFQPIDTTYGAGDSAKVGGDKVNANFSELYGVARNVPSKRRILAFGHSMIDLGRTSSPAVALPPGSYLSRGLVSWVRALAKGRIDCDEGDIYATTAADLQTLVATYLPSLVARQDADMVMVLGVTNTIKSKDGVDDWATHILPLLNQTRDALLASGKTILWIMDPPRGTAAIPSVGVTSRPLRNMMRYHRWVIAQASVPGFIIVDPWPVAADGGPEGYIRPSLVSDGLHPHQLGSYQMFGKLITPIIEQRFSPRNILPISNAEQWTAEQPEGWMTDNPMTLGTGGTITAPANGTLSGTVANSHTASLANGAGVTATLSKFIDADGIEWQRIVISGTPTAVGAEVGIMVPNVPNTRFSTGDQLEVVTAIRVAAGQTGINRICPSSFDAGAGNLTRLDMDRVTDTDLYPTDAIDAVLRVPRFTIGTPGTIGTKVIVTLLRNVAVSATIDVRAIATRKVLP